MIDADDFSYDDDTHLYRDARGMIVPSVTQIIKVSGLVDYSAVPPAVLEKARLRGKNVHLVTAERDRTGVTPWDWVEPGAEAQVEAYEMFLHDFRGRIKWKAIEAPVVTEISGMAIAGTPDRYCLIDNEPCVLDLKCSATFQQAWKIQLAMYEAMMPVQCSRLALQLLPTGKYKLTECDDLSDSAAAFACLVIATWRMVAGDWSPERLAK